MEASCEKNGRKMSSEKRIRGDWTTPKQFDVL
jgi:hypothetical protein